MLNYTAAGTPNDVRRAAVNNTLLETAAKGSLLLRETVARKAKAMEEELAGPSPTPLEGLLARRAVICWLLVHVAELDAADLAAKGVVEGGHIQRRADSSNRRFMQTLKTLSTVRRLIPAQKALKAFAGGVANDVEIGTLRTDLSQRT